MKKSDIQVHSDRFIPFRCQSAPKNLLPSNNEQIECRTSLPNEFYSSILKQKQLTFTKPLIPLVLSAKQFLNQLPLSISTHATSLQAIAPFKIIDCPEIVDNFYYNHFDMNNDYCAVALKQHVYLYNQKKSQTKDFNQRRGNTNICGVKFLGKQLMCTGQESGYIELYDVNRMRTVRFYKAHYQRLCAIEIDTTNLSLLYTGSKDYNINLHDLREKKPCTKVFKAHKSEVCGLTLKQNILASGSNDGKVKLWDIRAQKVITQYNYHKGAVKSISWCPWKSNILVMGGGKIDHKILIMDTYENKIQSTIQAKHQITSLCWRPSSLQLLFSQGKWNKGVIRVDNYFNKKLNKKKLIGCGGRIFCMKVNPNDQNIVCCVSGDQCLRFWDLGKDMNNK